MIRRRVSCFLALSCAISWSIFFLWPAHSALYGSRLMWAGIMWGPGLSGEICRRLFPAPPRIPIWGQNKAIESVFFLAPFVALCLFSWALGETEAMGSVARGLPLTAFVMTMGEELGWRGFLAPLLGSSMPRPAAWVATGVLWEAWHLPFRSWREPWVLVSHAGATIALACLLGYVAHRHRSLVMCITLHLWANLLVDFWSLSCVAALWASGGTWWLLTRGLVEPARGRASRTLRSHRIGDGEKALDPS